MSSPIREIAWVEEPSEQKSRQTGSTHLGKSKRTGLSAAGKEVLSPNKALAATFKQAAQIGVGRSVPRRETFVDLITQSGVEAQVVEEPTVEISRQPGHDGSRPTAMFHLLPPETVEPAGKISAPEVQRKWSAVGLDQACAALSILWTPLWTSARFAQWVEQEQLAGLPHSKTERRNFISRAIIDDEELPD